MRHQLARAIVEHAVRKAVHQELLLCDVARIEQQGKGDWFVRCIVPHRGNILSGDGQDEQPFIGEAVMHLLKLRHLALTGRAPGCPEIHQHNPAVQAFQVPCFPGCVSQCEVRVGPNTRLIAEFGQILRRRPNWRRDRADIALAPCESVATSPGRQRLGWRREGSAASEFLYQETGPQPARTGLAHQAQLSATKRSEPTPT